MTGSHPVSIWSLDACRPHRGSGQGEVRRRTEDQGDELGGQRQVPGRGDTDGLFKVIVAADTGEILGAHLYGQHVTDMIR